MSECVLRYLPKYPNYLSVAVLIDEVPWSHLQLASKDSVDLCISSALGQNDNPRPIQIRACHSFYFSSLIDRNEVGKNDRWPEYHSSTMMLLFPIKNRNLQCFNVKIS